MDRQSKSGFGIAGRLISVFSAAIFVSLLAVGETRADERSDSSYLGGGEYLRVKMWAVDDLALLILIGPDGSSTLLGSAEWNVANQGGAVDLKLDDEIPQGSSTLVVVLHNKRWVFGRSKAALELDLWAGSRKIHEISFLRRNLDMGVQLWEVYTIDRNGQQISVGRSGVNRRAELSSFIDQLDTKLRKVAGEEQTVGQAVVFGMIAGMMGEMGGPSGQGNPDVEYVYRCRQGGGCGNVPAGTPDP